jgi:hypothetical protein
MGRDGRTAIKATSESERSQPRGANEKEEGRSKQTDKQTGWAHQDILDKGDGTDGALCMARRGCAISISWETSNEALRGMAGK